MRGLLTWLVGFLVLSSLVTLPFSKPTATLQFVQLAHTIVGVLTALVGLAYLVVHLRQTMGQFMMFNKRSGRPLQVVIAVGVVAIPLTSMIPGMGSFALNIILLLCTLVALTLFILTLTRLVRQGGSLVATGGLLTAAGFFLVASGVGIAIGANKYDDRLLTAPYKLHGLMALLTTALIVWHVIKSRRRSATMQTTGRTYLWSQAMGRTAPAALTILGLVCLLLLAQLGGDRSELTLDPRALKKSDAHIHTHIPDECRLCHDQVVDQWADSSHHHAADNPLFTGLLRRTHAAAGAEGVAFCLGCHAPQALDPTRFELDQVIASDGYRAGVGCIPCHRMAPANGVADGDFELLPLAPEDFSFITDQQLQGGDRWPIFANALMNSRVDAHRTQFSVGPDRTRACKPCHIQTLTHPTGGRLNARLQDQFISWHRWKTWGGGPDCVTCHARAVITDSHYPIVDHRFLGGSTYAATLSDDPGLQADVISFLKGRYLPPEGTRPARRFSSQLRELFTAKSDVAHEDEASHLVMTVEKHDTRGKLGIKITTQNRGTIGHSFPNGPSDLFQVWLAATVTDASDQVVLEIGKDGPSPETPRLGHELLDAAGERIVDHSLHRVARIRDMGHVPAQGRHTLTLALPDPAPVWPLRADLRWCYRRIDPALLETVTGARMELPIVVMGRWTGVVEDAAP